MDDLISRADAIEAAMRDVSCIRTHEFNAGATRAANYNKQKKEFQFGICEDTPMLAEARLFQKIGEDAKKWKFEVREVTE